MRLLLTLAVVAWPTLADAEAVELVAPFEPPARAPIAEVNRLWVGKLDRGVAIDRMSVTLRDHDAGTIAGVTLKVTATGTRRDVSIPFEIPRGARVTGAAVTIGDGPREVASAMKASEARRSYMTNLVWVRDPILVEWTRENVAGDEIELRVFPIGAKEPALIELTIELPAAKVLEIDPGDRAIGHLEIVAAKRTAWTRVKSPKRLALAPRESAFAGLASLPYVKPGTSLYGAPARPTVVVPSCCRSSRALETVSSRAIRRHIKNHIAQLGRCYTKFVEYQGGLEGDAVLHFTILANGDVSAVTVDGSIDDVRVTECLADEVATWEFHAGEGTVQVNYPLRFRLATN